MDRAAGGPQAPPLIPAVDLSARVVYLPVRHHSPACAWHVGRAIRAIRPDAVLVEGPRDAGHLIPLLVGPRTRMPVAIYTTYVDKIPDGDAPGPARHAAYYPLCDYSPELVALRAAAEVGARARFVDLTFPEQVRAGGARGESRARSLQEERHLSHSALLREAGRRVGARDPDDLWDRLYEVDYERRDPSGFFAGVLAYCALARRDYTAEALAADGTEAREAAMAAAVAEEAGRVVVMTGGFHTVALLAGVAPSLPGTSRGEDDGIVALMRYGFEQLDRLNGYASGMPAPGFYQRMWEGRGVAEILVELARECRSRRLDASSADAIAALEQVRRLSALRGHPRPRCEDLLDAIRSVYIKGSDDVEGTAVLALARKLMAGDRVGEVPPEAGVPPLVEDFRRTAARLKVELDRVEAREVSLDLYRKARAREVGRFFHRLRFLEVPFAEWKAGPDHVSGERLERVQEVWSYRWSPAVESALIERSVFGSTLEEAAAARLLDGFAEAERQGRGRRADVAARLLLEACRMGLHRHAEDLVDRTAALVAEDPSFVSLVGAAELLLALHVAREPLEAHRLRGPETLAARAYDRACYLLPDLAATAESDEAETLDALNALGQSALTLGDTADRRDLRHGRLLDLLGTVEGNAAVRGAAAGLLAGDGRLAPADLASHLRGHLLGRRARGRSGASFLRGLLRTGRSVLWRMPEILAEVDAALASWDEVEFVRLLPDLRLAFADLTPRECDRVAEAVAGGARIVTMVPEGLGESDLLRAVAVERLVRESLARDGLPAEGGWDLEGVDGR